MMRSFVVSFLILASAHPALAAAPVCAAVHRSPVFAKSEDVGVYFVIPSKVGRGQLEDTRKLLPSFQEAGVRNIWLGPIHPQTKSEYGVHGKNDHGYWPSNHSQVSLGGEAALQRLISDAKGRGIGIWMDAVIGHFGYGEHVEVNGRTLSLKDKRYFRVSQEGTALVDPKMLELSAQMDGATNQSKILALQKEIAQIPIYHLPKIRHDNPEMADYIIQSYARFVDMGVTGFRIDAAKHVDLDFLKRFVYELQERGIRKHGKAPQFLFEFTLSSSKTLDAFVNYVREGAREPGSIYAIDFPLAYEIRRLQDPAYRMDWLMGFISYRWQQKQRVKNLVPFIENHDFEGALKDPFTAQLAYSVADFFSGQSPIVSHGLESTKRVTWDNRRQIEEIDPNAELLKMRKAISEALGTQRRKAEPSSFQIISADHHFLMAERKTEGKKRLVILVNKSEDNAETVPLKLSDSELRGEMRVVYSTGASEKVTYKRDSAKAELTVKLPPKSFVLLERTFP